MCFLRPGQLIKRIPLASSCDSSRRVYHLTSPRTMCRRPQLGPPVGTRQTTSRRAMGKETCPQRDTNRPTPEEITWPFWHHHHAAAGSSLVPIGAAGSPAWCRLVPPVLPVDLCRSRRTTAVSFLVCRSLGRVAIRGGRTASGGVGRRNRRVSVFCGLSAAGLGTDSRRSAVTPVAAALTVTTNPIITGGRAVNGDHW